MGSWARPAPLAVGDRGRHLATFDADFLAVEGLEVWVLPDDRRCAQVGPSDLERAPA